VLRRTMPRGGRDASARGHAALAGDRGRRAAGARGRPQDARHRGRGRGHVATAPPPWSAPSWRRSVRQSRSVSTPSSRPARIAISVAGHRHAWRSAGAIGAHVLPELRAGRHCALMAHRRLVDAVLGPRRAGDRGQLSTPGRSRCERRRRHAPARRRRHRDRGPGPAAAIWQIAAQARQHPVYRPSGCRDSLALSLPGLRAVPRGLPADINGRGPVSRARRRRRSRRSATPAIVRLTAAGP
jgi:hypothetical protein